MLPEASVEENIVVALARSKRPLTHYQLWKKHKVAASNKTVLVTLNRLEKKHMIDSRQEQVGRKRKFYNLTFFGLLASLTYRKAWQWIDEIAAAQKNMLPLVFGKWAFFKKEHVLDEVMERLKFEIFRLWKSSVSYFIMPETLSSFLAMERMSTRQKLASIEYKRWKESTSLAIDELTKLVSGGDECRVDFTSLVFGIHNLPWWPLDVESAYSEMNKENLKKLKLKVERQKKLLQVLRRDPELKKYIDYCLKFDRTVFEIQMENVNSWRTWIQSTTSHRRQKDQRA